MISNVRPSYMIRLEDGQKAIYNPNTGKTTIVKEARRGSDKTDTKAPEKPNQENNNQQTPPKDPPK